MDKLFLGIICSGIILLVIALGLATPSIKSVNPSSEDETVLMRLMHEPSPKRIHHP